MCSLSRIHLSLTLQHGWCSVVGWNAWDSSSHCRVVAGVQGGLGQVEVGPTYRHVKSLQGCSMKRMSIMFFIKHHQTMFFMVDVVDCYSNDCDLHNCSSLSLSDVVSCGKRMNIYSTFISSLCSFSLFFFSPREHSWFEFTVSDPVFTTWSKSCSLSLKTLCYSNISQSKFVPAVWNFQLHTIGGGEYACSYRGWRLA